MAILGFAAAWAGWLSHLHLGGLGSPADLLEEPWTDLRMRFAGPVDPPDEVVVVAIDDATVEAEKGYPLDRARLALLMEGLRGAGAKTLAIDILFVDPKDEAGDQALARALSSGPAVITAAGQFAADGPDDAAAPSLASLLRPLPSFAAAADVGLANVATTDAGTPRHMPLVYMRQADVLPAFALRAAALQRSADPVLGTDRVEIGGRGIALDLRWHLPLRFYGPTGTIRTISAEAILAGERPPVLNGAVAVVGVTATAAGDTFGTPFDPVMPGVEVQATAIAELLGGPRLVRDTTVRRVDALLAVSLALGGTLLVVFAPLTRSLLFAGIGVLVFLAANMLVFSRGFWMSASLPLVCAVPAMSLAILHRQIRERRRTVEAEGARAALRRFQPPALVDRIARDPTFLATPVERRVGVVFIDIAGFSGRSEAIGPSRTQDLLKAFHTLVVETAQPHNGLVLNFMGDGAMIVFGALDGDGDGDPAGDAHDAAFELLLQASRWLRLEARDGGGLGVRLGLHFGPVMLSRLGHEDQQQISVSGNTVNVASRLMEIAKERGASMAASTALLDARRSAGPAAGEPAVVHHAEIRGLHMPIDVVLW